VQDNVTRSWASSRAALRGILLTAVVLCSAPTAHADLIVQTQAIDISPQGDFAYKFMGEVQSPTTGLMHWKTFGGDIDLGTYFAFCVELLQPTPYGPEPYHIVNAADAGIPNEGLNGPGTFGPVGAARADLWSELWGRFFGTVVDGLTAAAFQGAVWEIAYDPDLNLLTGDFQAADPTQPSVAVAQKWLNSLDGTGPRANLVGLTSPDYQDIITERPPLVPEPSTFALGCVGAGAFALVAWRRRRNKRQAA